MGPSWLVQVIRRLPCCVGGCHQVVLALALVLLFAGVCGGARARVFLLLVVAARLLKDSDNNHLAVGVVGGDVEELPGATRLLSP